MKRFAVQMIDGSISSDWWKTIIEHFANVGDIFEIRCWKEEVSEIVRASLYGVAIDDKNEVSIKGIVTKELLEELLTDNPTEATEMFHILKNAENPHFYGFRLHTFRTTDKVIRYGINNQFDFAEHPAVIQRGEKRTINICVAVPDVA